MKINDNNIWSILYLSYHLTILLTFSFISGLLNYLTLVLSIYFILSINQSEAGPIKIKRFESGKIFNHKCGSDLGDSTKMNDRILKDRLNSILLACADTLVQTKALSEEYVSAKYIFIPLNIIKKDKSSKLYKCWQKLYFALYHDLCTSLR